MDQGRARDDEAKLIALCAERWFVENRGHDPDRVDVYTLLEGADKETIADLAAELRSWYETARKTLATAKRMGLGVTEAGMEEAFRSAAKRPARGPARQRRRAQRAK